MNYFKRCFIEEHVYIDPLPWCGPSTSDPHKGARFVMRILADQKFSQIDVQYVMKETGILMEAVVNEKLEEMDRKLKEEGCDHSRLIEDLKNSFTGDEIFNGLKNQYQQQKYFKQHFGMIPPTKVDLTGCEEFRRKRTGQPLEFQKENYIYVPLLDQLEAILNFDDVYKEIFKTKVKKNGEMTCFEDGIAYRHSAFSSCILKQSRFTIT